MKKKFISAILFGAICMAPASVMVSCSDYDDDIAGLRGDLDATKATLADLINQKEAALKGEISRLDQADQALANALEAAKAELKADDQAVLEAARKMVADAKSELQGAIDKIAEKHDKDVATLMEKDAELQRGIAGANAAIETANGLIQELDDRVSALEGDLKDVKTDLTTAKSALEEADKNLQEQITTLSEDLQDAIGRITKAEAAIQAQKKALENYYTKSEADAAAQAQIDAAIEALRGTYEGTLQQLDKDLRDLIAAEIRTVNSMIGEIPADDQKKMTVADWITKHQNAISKLQDQLTGEDGIVTRYNEFTKAGGEFDLLKDQVSDLETTLKARIDVLKISMGKLLRSLVFMPNLYVDGIEATEYSYIPYKAYTAWGDALDATVTQGKVTFAKGIIPAKEEARTINPIDSVEYHMNPSSAVVAEANMISRDVEVISRASAAAPSVQSFDFKNGVLKVRYTAAGANVGNEAGNDASVFATQARSAAEGKDTLITSDYAMLYSSKKYPVAVAFSDAAHGGVDCKGGSKKELYATPKAAIEATTAKDPSFLLKYDDAEGIDLQDFVETHYTWETKTKNAGEHKVWKLGDVKRYGFYYKFDLVNYTVDGNKTSDSKYAKLDGSVIKASTVDANGEPTGVQGASSIGREPLVRVMLMDSKNNPVVWGFFRVKIVRDIDSKVANTQSWTKDQNICNALTLDVKWSAVSSSVLDKVGMSNEEFHALYKIMADGDGKLLQYVPKGSPVVDGVVFEQVANESRVGEVIEKKEAGDMQTSALQWTISEEEIQQIVSNIDKVDANNHDGIVAKHENGYWIYTIYVCYARNNNVLSEASVFIPLEIRIKDRAKATSLGSKPLETYWKWNAAKMPGMNVAYPQDGGNTLTYTVDLDQVWEGNKVNTTAPYKYFFMNSTFTANGKTYTLEAVPEKPQYVFEYGESVWGLNKIPFEQNYNNDFTADWLVGQESQYYLDYDLGVYDNKHIWYREGSNMYHIAVLDPATGVVTFQNNDKAKEILNLFGTNTLDEPQAFFNIGVAVKDGCGYVKPYLNDRTRFFRTYLLRPINVAGADGAYVVDANANASKIDLIDMLEYSDWRVAESGSKVNFVTEDLKNIWLFAYYNVKRLTVNLSQVKTNMNQAKGTFKLLSEVNPAFKLEQVDGLLNGGNGYNKSNYNKQVYSQASSYQAFYDILKKEMGSIVYKNNSTPIGMHEEGGFNQLQIPVTVEYEWGKVNVVVTVDIKPEGVQG